mgnify:CR=1 FL=1
MTRTDAELRAKFDENAEGFLGADTRQRVAESVGRLETLPDMRALVDLLAPPRS